MPDRERKGVPEHRSNALKGPLPEGPSAHSRIRKMQVSAVERRELLGTN